MLKRCLPNNTIIQYLNDTKDEKSSEKKKNVKKKERKKKLYTLRNRCEKQGKPCANRSKINLIYIRHW